MFVEVTGNLVQGDQLKEGRFLINPEYIAALGVNGTKASFHLSNGMVIYSDANLTDVLKKIEALKLYGD
jgi:hypothetical protein